MSRTVHAFALALIMGCAAADARAEPLPAGWIVFEGVRDEKTMACANWSHDERAVSTTHGTVEITTRDPSYQEVRTFPFAGGQIKLVDQGEFGGGVHWIPASGAATQIIEANGVGGVRINAGLLVLTGLNHMGLRSGKLWLITGVARAVPQAREIVDLGEQPEAFSKRSDGSVIIATDNKIVAVSRDGEASTVFQSRLPAYRGLYPNSITETAAGTIYVGMRHFVVRLVREQANLREEWLVPKSCPTLVPTNELARCTCQP